MPEPESLPPLPAHAPVPRAATAAAPARRRLQLAWLATVVLAVPAAAVGWAMALAAAGLPARPPATLGALAWMVVLVPLLEECAFRGGLQPLLARQAALAGRSWAGVTAANALTSVAFAALHLVNRSPAQALAVLPASLLFGRACEDAGGRLWAPVALHAWSNACLAAALHLAAR
ncbi:JDVT-CTERM system glutamic-type intramembrane protease MrtJ [Piscinibacter sakaiensis]|uniref:CAAX prenyl protease 2/Lysostaphin resistance protein A-like domain-containing protein n=1 Tax=Piscinibacter sakaiensis TaxID=1547922 RepID=A0A0K8P8Q0_PISS1|nr:JDVT-CTERM system glutamic-type intramembrane protease [Piscinibacter sakaiensis]GAP38889.1 hypothetical protein ISF6_0202 [Piscinibacter sakaiensis]